MQNRGELSLTLSVLALVLMTVGSIMGISIARNRITTSSSASSSSTTVSSTRWFTSNPGIACNAWFTCTQSGAKIQGISLVQSGVEYKLGDEYNSFKDKNGKSFVNKTMSSCQGGDETVSIQFNPDAISKMSATFKKSYNVDKSSVILSINTGGGAKTDFFIFDVPAGFNRNAPANLEMRFKAQTAGDYEDITQDTSIKGCEADGKPAEATNPPIIDPNKETTISWIFDDISESDRFGDAKKFIYEARICDNVECKSASKGETSILHPTGATNQVIDKTLLKSNSYLQLSYSYLNGLDKEIPISYLVRHRPFFEIEINRGDEFVDKCYAFDSTDIDQNKSCFSKILPGDHIDIHVYLDMKVTLSALGKLPEGKSLSNVKVEVCNQTGTGCYTAVTNKFTDVLGEEPHLSFPMNYEPYMIRFTGINPLIDGNQYVRLKMETGYLSLSYDLLHCEYKGISTECIFDLKRDHKDFFSYVRTDWDMLIDLSQSGEIIQQQNPSPSVEPSPSVAPSNQPSPIPSPSVEPSPIPSGPPEIPVDFEFKINMYPERIDWAKLGIHQVYVIVQACDTDETYKNCLGSYKEIYKHTYSTREASDIEEELLLQMTKGKKKFNIGLRYLNEGGGYINSSNYAPHMPIIKFRRYDDKSEYKKNCNVQATELSCDIEVYDTHNNKWNSSITVEIVPVGSFLFFKAQSNLLPPGLVNKDDKIQVTSRVYNDKTAGLPLYQNPPVVLTHEALFTGGMSALYFPMISYDNVQEPLTYEVDVEYIRGLITPKTPNIDWFILEEHFFDCSTHIISTPLDSQTHRLRCKIKKPTTNFEKYVEINNGMFFAVNKFIVEDGVASEYNPKGSAEFAQLFKELRSADLNDDKVVSILDLTTVFDAYYATGDFPEDINNDNVVNIQDAMIVVSHLGETAP